MQKHVVLSRRRSQLYRSPQVGVFNSESSTWSPQVIMSESSSWSPAQNSEVQIFCPEYQIECCIYWGVSGVMYISKSCILAAGGQEVKIHLKMTQKFVKNAIYNDLLHP